MVKAYAVSQSLNNFEAYSDVILKITLNEKYNEPRINADLLTGHLRASAADRIEINYCKNNNETYLFIMLIGCQSHEFRTAKPITSNRRKHQIRTRNYPSMMFHN